MSWLHDSGIKYMQLRDECTGLVQYLNLAPILHGRWRHQSDQRELPTSIIFGAIDIPMGHRLRSKWLGVIQWCQCFTIFPPHVLEGRTYFWHYILSRMDYFRTLWGLVAVRSIWCAGVWKNSARKIRRAWHGHGNVSIEKNCKPCWSNTTCKKCVFSGIRFLSGQIKLATWPG